MGCLSCNSTEGHVHDRPNEEPRRSLSSQSLLNLGIYLDEDTITVGTITTRDSKEPEIILDIPAEITFFNEKIMIGGNSEKNRMHDNHFRVYDLIKETASPSPVISLTPGDYVLQEEEILAIFFEQLHCKVKTAKNVSTIGNVVITLPFNVTSLEKERIKIATKAAGLGLDLRIISSLLTTAVAFAREKKFYKKKNAGIRPIFISQYLRQSFTMALVEMGPDFIATKKCISSINLQGNLDKHFLEYHSQMFDGRTILSEKTRYVYSIYKKGVRRLEICCNRIRQVDPIVIKPSTKESTLDKNYLEIFTKDVQFTVTNSGPLAGACLFSSRFLATTEIPGKLLLCDASLTNLSLTSPISRKKWGRTQNRNYCPGVIFEPNVKISMMNENLVTLKEEYYKRKVESTVGQYKVIVDKGSIRNSSGTVQVQLLCRVDRDGIYKVGPIFPPGINGAIVKINAPSVDSDSSSDFCKLRSYYKALQVEKPLAPYHSFFRLTSIPEGSKEDLLEHSESEKKALSELSTESTEDQDLEVASRLEASEESPCNVFAVGEDVNLPETDDTPLMTNTMQTQTDIQEDDEAIAKRYMMEKVWAYDFAMQKLVGKTRDEIEEAHQKLMTKLSEDFSLDIASAGIQGKPDTDWVLKLRTKLGFQLLEFLHDEQDSGTNTTDTILLNDPMYQSASEFCSLQSQEVVLNEGTPMKIEVSLENGMCSSSIEETTQINSVEIPNNNGHNKDIHLHAEVTSLKFKADLQQAEEVPKESVEINGCQQKVADESNDERVPLMRENLI